jgi:DNA-binding CsgD family transcriptional regulator
LGQTTLNQSGKLTRTERRGQVIQLRREGLSMERIADRLDVSHQTVRNDLRYYLDKLDQENLQAASALRAEEFATLQRASELVESEIFHRNDLSRVPDLLKLSEQKRKIYALDVMPVRKAEIQHKKSVVVELITTLRTRISPFAFGEVLQALSDDDTYQLLGTLVEASSDERTEPPAELLKGHGSA